MDDEQQRSATTMKHTYREEVAQLAEWCGAHNLSLCVGKTKVVVMDFRRNSVDHPLLTTNTTSLSKKAQQLLHFLCQLKSVSLPPPILTTFYRCTIDSVLTSCITVWYGTAVPQTTRPYSGQ